MNNVTPIEHLYAADVLGVVASPVVSSWPPRIAAKPAKGRKRKLAVAEYPVEIRQLPRTIVRVRGADCPSCEQPLLVGRVAVSVSGVLMHPGCAARQPQTSRTTNARKSA